MRYYLELNLNQITEGEKKRATVRNAAPPRKCKKNPYINYIRFAEPAPCLRFGFLAFLFPVAFPAPGFFFFVTTGVVVSVGVGSAPLKRTRPSLSVSVIMGLAAGRNLYSFEYLEERKRVVTFHPSITINSWTNLEAWMTFGFFFAASRLLSI